MPNAYCTVYIQCRMKVLPVQSQRNVEIEVKTLFPESFQFSHYKHNWRLAKSGLVIIIVVSLFTQRILKWLFHFLVTCSYTLNLKGDTTNPTISLNLRDRNICDKRIHQTAEEKII